MKANHTVDYMTAVLTAFRSNEEKVAAAVAECRRMSIEVLPPDVHRSHLEFTVEGDAIRFGLLAVKNVGQGAIESIIAARDEGGEFRSLTDFCTRIDLRLANRKVLEALAKVGALSPFGHPSQILLGLDDAIAAAQATQRDRISGQTSLFDLGAADATTFERPLPAATEVPVRERLRWEKELLGLYLSEHPMGEVAEQVGRFVTAYSSDLRDESLDGQRIVVGGIVTGVRTVITKAKASMAIVTMEDLQGTIEVVVFPRLYEQTMSTWRDGEILLVAGRVDHKGEEASLLADLAVDWDAAAAAGPDAFARQVAAGERGGGGRRGPWGNGNGHANGSGNADGYGGRPLVAVGPGPGTAGHGRRLRVGRGAARERAVRLTTPRQRQREPRRADSRQAPCRRSHQPSRCRPIRRRRAPRSVRTRTTSRRSRTRRAPGSSPTRRPTARSTPVPTPSSMSASREARHRIASSARWRRSRQCCATGPARPASSSTCRPLAAGPPCRWSCAVASPTTPNCSRRCGAGSATGWSSCALAGA